MNQNIQNHPLHASKSISPSQDVQSERPSSPVVTDDEKIDIAAIRILNQYRSAFEELAK